MTEFESYATGHARPAPMSLAELRKILRYNPESGGFTWLINSTRVRVGSIAGTVNTKGYVVIKIRGQLYKAHRLAWFFATGIWPDRALEIDHINEIKGDNRLCNLRLVTRGENQRNIASKRTWKPKPKSVGPRKIGRGFERPGPMSRDELRAMLSYCRETGLLTWEACPAGGQGAVRVKPGTPVTCKSVYGYVVVRVNKILYPAHRIIWLWETGDWPPDTIDHVNGIRDDNRWSNLRLASQTQNQINRVASRPNTSGYRGVVSWKGRWKAQIKIDGRQTHLGIFPTAEAAYEAYCTAAREHHGDFARFD